MHANKPHHLATRQRPLACETLRLLTLDAHEHPRGQPHLSAASGLVCAHGHVYVVADDEHHLGIFSSLHSPGRLHRLLTGDLPGAAAARKRRKADFETLALVPVGLADHGAVLLALGSGSAPGRDAAVVQALDAQGAVTGAPRRLDLAPLYDALRAHLGALNVEGAVVVGDELVLFNRGGSGARGANGLLRCALRPLLQGPRDEGSVRAGWATPAKARHAFTWQPCDLGAVHGVGLGFTDAAALGGGHFLFTAVAEDSTDSVADGACVGSVIGCLGADGGVRWVRALAGSPKVEGIAVNDLGATGVQVCLVTDADDPQQPSRLLRLQLPPMRQWT